MLLPRVPSRSDVAPPDVSPRDDGDDDEDEGTAEQHLPDGGVHAVGADQVKDGDHSDPKHFPGDLEQQDGQHPYGIREPEERQEGDWIAVVGMPQVVSGDMSPQANSVLFNCFFVVVVAAVIPWAYAWRRS